jgi:hypothetical protein
MILKSDMPVLVAVQPAGAAPVFKLSKFTVSARVAVASAIVVSATQVLAFGLSFCSRSNLDGYCERDKIQRIGTELAPH